MPSTSRAQQIARKHHYVSAGYLAQFTNTGNGKGVCCAVDFSTKIFFRPKPKDVAFEWDFNQIESETLAPDALEAALGAFESRAIRVIRDICKTGRLPDMEIFSYVYNLITLFAVRNPVLRGAADAAEKHTARIIMDLMVSSENMYNQQVEEAKEGGFIRPDLNVPYKQMRDSVRREAYTISIPTQRHINTELQVFNNVLDTVAQRYWSVMTVKPGAPNLITCDRPAPTRLGAKTIVFTISPRHALMGAQELIAPCEIEIDTPAVGGINAELIEQANKQIYSKDSRVTLMDEGQLITVNLQELFSK